ncbi:7SK snRNA methylphosphate capping enzyme-like [Carassius gibelio]|uniref:7SK snRNA methylphosphate capping enzyme-like n=1 Tax=Carassius gibelio TaxID=101364 RepID=UPI002278285D|nr:7SK snRNA methylphosphate capping enzyme-like [Carassius gibelio]
MIEMSFDKETVLSCEGQTDLTSQQHSELTGNDTGALQPSGKTTVINLSEEAGSETSLEEREITASTENTAVSESGVAGVEASTQNGTQQPKPQQQKVSKRRSTMSAGFKHPSYGKRRRRANSESESVLPTNFLLGGNIFDPLNLNSLLDEEVNRALNAETPKSSPLPARSRDPVEILIPRDITDPLNLNCPSARDGSLLVSPLKSGGGRRRHRNKHHGASAGKASGEGIVAPIDFPESDGCAGGRDEGTTALSVTPPHSHVPEDQTQSDSTRLEAQGASKPSLTTNGGEAKEKTIDTSTAAPSNRQRKRRRAGSRPENADRSDGTRNWGARSGGHFPETSQPHPNHWRSQSNSNQHQQQNKKKFQYGNYNKYYGYRNPGLSEDPRVRLMNPEWFRGKEVLDLGCNTGHLTLTIARNWRPARIVGLDIDAALIHAARHNIRHYLSEVHTEQARRSGENGEGSEEKSQREEKDEERFVVKEEKGENECTVEGAVEVGREEREIENSEADCGGTSGKDEASVGLPDGKHSFPVSLQISRGPIVGPPLPEINTERLPPGDFPANVTFVKGNYVLENDLLLQTQREEYDVVLCLSVTKWVHLNWGDAGLKRLFHRVYKHLRPGGLFILEPQPWNSYGKRKKLTETIFKNYHGIRLKPDRFSSYLTAEVGFSSYELIATSQNHSRGFQRPIYLFRKGRSPQK